MKSSAAVVSTVEWTRHPARTADFVTLTKPRLNFLVLITTLGGMYIAAPDGIALSILVHALVGTALVAGGASALNQVWERETDGLMRRTRLRPIPVKPAELVLRALELARLSPLAEWHYKTAHKDSFVDASKAQRLLGWQPRLSNSETLIQTYDWYLANRERVGKAGVTHRVPWNQQALGLLKRLS